jgi:adenylate cyclase
MPVGGSMAVTHVCLITYLVRFEQRERRRTKDIFGKVVSPDVVRELLDAETLSVSGARRRLTVFFADVRGFTPMTDAMQQRAADYVARHSLSGEAATKYFDAQAGEILETVNLYLGLIAVQVKKHGGTLDKYIGDCVMAFWGAPVENPRHAVCCVRAVIEAQRTILAVNKDREAENRRREEENLRRASKGEELRPMRDILSLGSGINTGVMTVGLMGSDAHLVNYTVFGREVNLASRLESASGRGRILIGETTYADLLRDDPPLAATCIRQPPIQLKGFRESITTYEVPWRPAEVSPAEAHQSDTALVASMDASI